MNLKKVTDEMIEALKMVHENGLDRITIKDNVSLEYKIVKSVMNYTIILLGSSKNSRMLSQAKLDRMAVANDITFEIMTCNQNIITFSKKIIEDGNSNEEIEEKIKRHLNCIISRRCIDKNHKSNNYNRKILENSECILEQYTVSTVYADDCSDKTLEAISKLKRAIDTLPPIHIICFVCKQILNYTNEETQKLVSNKKSSEIVTIIQKVISKEFENYYYVYDHHFFDGIINKVDTIKVKPYTYTDINNMSAYCKRKIKEM